MLALVAPPALAEVEVTDGDTLRIDGERIRLWGIDAPEGNQTCLLDGAAVEFGPAASEALVAMIGAGRPDCRRVDTDRYGRTVAVCSLDGIDLGGAMVAAGWAWDYPQFSGGRYAGQERGARAARRGVWSAICQAPWEWRRR
jgi:endonuclease YncB( thermonuclease family)